MNAFAIEQENWSLLIKLFDNVKAILSALKDSPTASKSQVIFQFATDGETLEIETLTQRRNFMRLSRFK